MTIDTPATRSYKYTIKDAQQIAQKKNGICLSEKWSSKLQWQCERGHSWYDSFGHISKGGCWCPFCSGRRRTSSDMYKEVLNVVQSKQGKCLSETYTNTRELMLFECFNKHQWYASSLNIKQGKWCPYCSKYLTENKCRYILESLLQNKFIKYRFTYNEQKLELDGYNSALSLAFEYQGEQHYRLVKKWHKDLSGFQRQQYRDKKKVEYCKRHKINLIIIPFNIFKNDQDLIEFIADEIKKNGHYCLTSNVDFSKFYSACSPLNRLKEIAEYRNGNLISNQYNGTHKKLTWTCQNGHCWDATPCSVKSGSWCPECAKNTRWDNRKRINIEFIRTQIMSREGKCLSVKYIDSKTKLQWECAEGHKWTALWDNIRTGSWCPLCSNKRKGKRK